MLSNGPASTNPLQVLTLAQLRRRTSMKWRTHPADVLPLWVAEMDVLLAEPIHRALSDALASGDTGYPAGPFAEALSEFAIDRWGWSGLAVDRTAIVPDVMMGIVEMLRLVSSDGDAVVVNSPVYPPFYSFVEHMNRKIVESPLGPDGRIDLDILEQTFLTVTAASGRAAYLLCSPHNPTGTVHTEGELISVAALANQYGVRIIADEIHGPVVLPGASFVPFLSVPGSESALSLMSASKGWNLAGLKAALAMQGRMPPQTSPGFPRKSVTAPATSGSLRIPRHFVSPEAGSTRFFRAWTTTADCWETFSPSTFRRSSSIHHRRRIWLGLIARNLASMRTSTNPSSGDW